MASNSELQMVSSQGWLTGYPNLVAKENGRWWRTRQWLVQLLLWLVIVNGILAIVLWVAPKMEAQGGGSAATPLAVEGLTVFLAMLGIAPAVGVVILGQDAVIGEKQAGTAAWVLSKPASRSAFILSKVVADAIGILVTMVIFQGAVAYLQIWLATGKAYPLLGYIAALGLCFIDLLFYLALAIMLGTLFDGRGWVIGMPLLLLFGSDLFLLIAPWLAAVMPWKLPALATGVATGQPLPTLAPLVATIAWCLLFIGVALWRFNREEF